MSNIFGTLVSIKFNIDCKKDSGDGTFKGHGLIIEDTHGQQRKYKIAAKSPATEKMLPYLKKLEEGEDVTVCLQKQGKFENVVAVKKGHVKNDYNGKSGYSKGGSKSKSAYDNTGAIQGMVLNKAIDIVIACSDGGLGEADDAAIVRSIVNAAQTILKARVKTDKLVLAALKDSTVDESEDEEEIKPKKKAKSKPVDDDDDDEAFDEDDVDEGPF